MDSLRGTERHQGGRKGPIEQLRRHQGGAREAGSLRGTSIGLIGEPARHQGGTREAGKDLLDSLGGTREAG